MASTAVFKKQSFYYWIIFGLLALRLLFYMHSYSVDLFNNDQWVYLRNIIFPASLTDGYLTTLGPHRLGLGYPLYKAVLEAGNFDNRYISFLVAALAILNAGMFSLLTYRIKGRLLIWDLCIPLTFMGMAAYAVFLNNPNITLHQLVFFFLIGISLLLRSKLSPLKFLLLLIFIPLISFTGNGIIVTASLIALAMLLIFTDPNHRLWWGAIMLVGMVSIISFSLMAPPAALDCSAEEFPAGLRLLRFVKGMLLTGLVINYQDSLLSWILFLVVLMAFGYGLTRFFRKTPFNSAKATRLLPLVYSFAFLAVALLGRWCYPLYITSSSRYIPHMALAFLGLLLILPAKGMWRWAFPAVVSLFLIYGEVKFHIYFEPHVKQWKQDHISWKNCYRQTGDIKTCIEKKGFSPYPWPERAKLKAKLERMEELNSSYRK